MVPKKAGGVVWSPRAVGSGMPRGPPVAAAIVDWKARQCSGALGAVVASAGTLVASLSLKSCLLGSLPSH